MRPRLLTAATMLIENFCLVRVRTGVWLPVQPPAGQIPVADADLAAPMNHCLLALGPRRDRLIIRSKPGRNLSRIARRRACQGFWRGETPPLQIERHRRQAECLAEFLAFPTRPATSGLPARAAL